MNTFVSTASGLFDLSKVVALNVNKNGSIGVVFKNGCSSVFDSFALGVVSKNVGNAELNPADIFAGKPLVDSSANTQESKNENAAFSPAFYLVADADGYVELCTTQNLMRRIGRASLWVGGVNVRLDDGYVFNPALSLRNSRDNAGKRI